MKTLWMRRPETVEAIRFDGKNQNEIRAFTGDYFVSTTDNTVTILCVEDDCEYRFEVTPDLFVVKNSAGSYLVMDGNTLNARYALVARGKASEIECDFYSQSMLDASRVCD